MYGVGLRYPVGARDSGNTDRRASSPPILGTLQRLLEIAEERPFTGLAYAVLMVLPGILPPPEWLEGLLALPSALAYLAASLIAPAFLFGEPTAEFEVSV
ncbi:hypothetical protein, partial [Methanopyrus sp.]